MTLSPAFLWWRAAARVAGRAAAMVALWGALAACGPGIGGTGTGDDVGPPAFGATVAPVCDSALGAALDCPGAQPGTPAPVGTTAVAFASDRGLTATRARFEGNTLYVELLCTGQEFRGQFGRVDQDGTQQGRYYGSLAAGGAADGSPTVAEVEALPDAALRLTLRDALGQAVWGPVTLRRSDAQAPPPACP